MRIRPFIPLLLSTLALPACHKPAPKEPALASVLPVIPLPPGGQPLVREGGADALQIVVVTPAGPDSIAAYYRRVLSTDPFRLVNERTTGKTTVFYAEQNGPSIWITVAPNGSEGSQVTIAGAREAAKDTTKAARP